MKMTQTDYDERKQRQNDGVATDEDRRLIKLYESDGWEQSRLKRERAAKDAVKDEAPNTGDDEDTLTSPEGGRREDWIAFAQKVNTRLADSERPIADPARATKTDLEAKYRGYAQQAGG